MSSGNIFKTLTLRVYLKHISRLTISILIGIIGKYLFNRKRSVLPHALYSSTTSHPMYEKLLIQILQRVHVLVFVVGFCKVCL